MPRRQAPPPVDAGASLSRLAAQVEAPKPAKPKPAAKPKPRAASRRPAGGLSDADMRRLVESAPVAILCVDLNCVVTYSNPASAKALRRIEQALPCPVEAIVGQPMDIFKKDPEQKRRLLADPSQLPVRTRVEVGDDILEMLINALYDDSGAYSGVIVTWEVITEQVALETRQAELREREERLQAAVEQMLDVVRQAKDGDLTVRTPVRGSDTIGQLGEGLEDFLENLRRDVTRMAENAHQLATSAEQLTAVSQQMAGSATQTSSQVSVVSAACEEVTRNSEVAPPAPSKCRRRSARSPRAPPTPPGSPNTPSMSPSRPTPPSGSSAQPRPRSAR